MHLEYIDKLKTDFPSLFEGRCEISCGPGWFDLLYNLCNRIKNYESFVTIKDYEPVKVYQIKEKFGTLRFYYHGGNEYVFGLVDIIEDLTAITCEECGKPGKLEGKTLLRVRCEDCSVDEA